MTLREIRWPLAFVLVALVVGTLAGITSAAPAHNAPQTIQACSWTRITNTQSQFFHRASAMDSVGHMMYLYGGLNQQNAPQNGIEAVDLTDPSASNASVRRVTAAGAVLQIFGAAGAFRPKGDESAAFFIGGAKTTAGAGENLVQRYTVKTNVWESMTVPGSFTDRVFLAAAYDPEHDAIVVYGGTRSCDAYDGPMTIDCANSVGDTLALKFDAMTGAPSWVSIPAGNAPGSIFGHTMVYDSVGKRMLLFGGTDDGGTGRNTTFALDLSDPDIAKAKWTRLTTAGSSPPSRFFHSATFDAANNRMIIASGISQNLAGGNESSQTDTWALQLGGTSNTWSNLQANAGERIGSTMEYDANHMAPIKANGRQEFRTGSLTVSNEVQELGCTVPPTPTERPTTGPVGTDTPVPTGGVPTVPPPTPTVIPGACAFITNRVPAAVINAALSNPAGVQGYNELQNPGVPESPWNVRRTHLSLRNPSVPWHPLYNGLIYKAGCP